VARKNFENTKIDYASSSGKNASMIEKEEETLQLRKFHEKVIFTLLILSERVKRSFASETQHLH
jgi:hypothetical protein